MNQPDSDDPQPQLRINTQVRDALYAAARASVDIERGGILVGYREGNGVIIDDIIEVRDSTAGHSTYLRRERPAQQALEAYLEHAGDDSAIGYVGEWHSHPKPVPPSPVDRGAMRAMTRSNRLAVALVVAALGDDLQTVTLHALVSVPRRLRHRLLGHHVTANLIVD